MILTKKISWISLFVALSVIGAMIKIPALIGSVALDIFPALVASALFGGGIGAFIGGLGHFVSALLGGMPLGPLHIIITLEMALLVWLFGFLYNKGKKWASALVFWFTNAVVAPLPFLFILGPAFYLGIIPSLLVGSALNMIIALVISTKVIARLRPGIRKEGMKHV